MASSSSPRNNPKNPNNPPSGSSSAGGGAESSSSSGVGGATSQPNPQIESINNQLFAIYYEKLTAVQDAIDKKHLAFEKKLKISENRTKDLTKDLAKQTKNLETEKTNLIEVVGVFVAIFTFISVEIKILNQATDFLRIAGLSILLFSGLFLFIYLLFVIAENWVGKEAKYLARTLWVSGGLALIGIVLVTIGDYKNPAAVANNKEFMDLKAFSEESENKIQNLNLSVKSLKKDLDILNGENADLKNVVESLQKKR